MRRPPPSLSPEVRALLEREREVPPVPATTRARALARARAALLAGSARRSPSVGAAPRTRWAAAAALVCVASAAVGAAAYEIRAHLVPRPPARERATAALAAPPARRPAPSLPAPPPVDDAVSAQPAEAPRLSRADALRAELRLLRQARGAVARGDFAASLPPIAEHARRFKDGRLAEEREALRVKALAGLGRTDEARRAAASFVARFPHSVLLPAVREMPASGP